MQTLKISEPDYARLSAVLRKVEFFTALTIDQLAKIMPYILLYGYRKGETVFKQGGEGDAFYIILAGACSVRVKKGWFFSSEVGRLKDGEFFGEMALFTDEKRSATVVCLADSRISVFLKKDFAFLVKENPAFALEVEKIAEARRFHTKHSE